MFKIEYFSLIPGNVFMNGTISKIIRMFFSNSITKNHGRPFLRKCLNIYNKRIFFRSKTVNVILKVWNVNDVVNLILRD